MKKLILLVPDAVFKAITMLDERTVKDVALQLLYQYAQKLEDDFEYQHLVPFSD